MVDLLKMVDSTKNGRILPKMVDLSFLCIHPTDNNNILNRH